MANFKIQNVRIQLKNDTAANWANSTLVPLQGELCLDRTHNVIRIGDGTHTFSELPNAGSVESAGAYDENENPTGISPTHGAIKVNGVNIGVYDLLAASTTALGGVKSAANVAVKGSVTVDASGNMTVQYVDFADELKTARNISINENGTYALGKDVVATGVAFKGNQNINLAAALTTTGVDANTGDSDAPYVAVKVDAKGRVTDGTEASDFKATDSALGLVQGHVKDTTTPANNIDKVFVDSDGKLSIEEASKAAQLTTARTISASGDATGSVSFDGTTNVDMALTLANSGVTAGAYSVANVTVDSKGRVTAISAEPTTATGGTNADASKLVRLDSNGKLDNSIIPALAIGEVQTVEYSASETVGQNDVVAFKGITSAQSGDVVIVTTIKGNEETAEAFLVRQKANGDGVYIYAGNTSGTDTYNAANWKLIKVPGSAVQTVNGKVGPDVTLTTTDINEGSNLYYTSTRAETDASRVIANGSYLIDCGNSGGDEEDDRSNSNITNAMTFFNKETPSADTPVNP